MGDAGILEKSIGKIELEKIEENCRKFIEIDKNVGKFKENNKTMRKNVKIHGKTGKQGKFKKIEKLGNSKNEQD